MSVSIRGGKGFTLIEIMVVTTIITLIIGIAMPNFLRMKANSSQAAAIKTLRTLNTAFEEFWQDQTPHHYPITLAELASVPAALGSPPYVDQRITDDSVYQGYYFSVVTPDAYTYSIQATPINPTISGENMYAISEGGTALVCYNQGGIPGFIDPGGSGKEVAKILPDGHPGTSLEIPSR